MSLIHDYYESKVLPPAHKVLEFMTEVNSQVAQRHGLYSTALQVYEEWLEEWPPGTEIGDLILKRMSVLAPIMVLRRMEGR